MSDDFAVPRQCADCPFRLDVAPGKFHADRYRHLFLTCVVEEGAVMACHNTPAGRERACAGFLAAEGERLALPRMARSAGMWSPESLGLADVPQHRSFEEMAAANGFRADRAAVRTTKAGLLAALAGPRGPRR